MQEIPRVRGTQQPKDFALLFSPTQRFFCLPLIWTMRQVMAMVKSLDISLEEPLDIALDVVQYSVLDRTLETAQGRTLRQFLRLALESAV